MFEWNGSMLHAKSAVADDRWARVGSTNLNIASWLTNFELDVAIEDERLVKDLAELYEQDLSNATEIILGTRYRVRASRPPDAAPNARRTLSGSAGRAAAGAVSVGAAVGAALTPAHTGSRGSELLAIVAVILLAVAVIAVLWPPALAFPIAVIAAWVGIVALMRAARLWRERGKQARRAVSG